MSLKDLGDHDIRLGIPSVKPFERLLPLSYGTDFQDDVSMISKILICLSLGLTIIFPSYLHKQLHFTVILYIELLPGLIQSKPHCKKKKNRWDKCIGFGDTTPNLKRVSRTISNSSVVEPGDNGVFCKMIAVLQ